MGIRLDTGCESWILHGGKSIRPNDRPLFDLGPGIFVERRRPRQILSFKRYILDNVIELRKSGTALRGVFEHLNCVRVKSSLQAPTGNLFLKHTKELRFQILVSFLFYETK